MMYPLALLEWVLLGLCFRGITEVRAQFILMLIFCASVKIPSTSWNAQRGDIGEFFAGGDFF